MKYLKAFLSVIYLTIFVVLSVVWTLKETIRLHPWNRFEWLFFSGIIKFYIFFIIIISIIFLIYQLLVKNRILYFSVISLTSGINIIIINIFGLIYFKNFIYLFIIGFVIGIGLIILSFYLRDKYKKSLK